MNTPTQRRYAFKPFSISPLRRTILWFLNVYYAIQFCPPKNKNVRVFLNPDDPGYDDAPFIEITRETKIGGKVYEEMIKRIVS